MNYYFFIATPNTEEKGVDLLLSSSVIDKETITIKYENVDGLPKCYNNFLKSREWKDEDRVIFCHDDLIMSDIFWQGKLDLAHTEFDVVGLAGGHGTVIKHPQAMWNLICSKHSGMVTHTDGNKYWTNTYGPNGIKCLFIDGLFISVNPTVLKEKEIEFDEDFMFHHYDFSFNMRCNLKEISIGTPPCPIFVIHKGLGELNQEFQESNKLAIQKYYSL